MNILSYYQLDYQGVGQLTGKLEILEPKPTNIVSKTIIPEQFKTDVEALSEYSGMTLTHGMTIRMTLQEALSVMPRKRHRLDSYKALMAYLRDELAVTLIINSKKSKNNEE